MKKTSIDGMSLKEAFDRYGSLQKAISAGKSDKKALDKEVSQRKDEIHSLILEKDKLVSGIADLKKQFDAEKKKVELVAANVAKWERQYNLFEGFLAMLLTSPSVMSSHKNLSNLLEELISSGWAMTKTPDQLRGYFVRTVMGDYLKCFRCKACGNKFIVNKEPYYSSISNYYECPACHTSSGVEPDDSFLKAMVSEELLKDIVKAGDIQKENDTLKPLEAFFNIHCEICANPITEWDKENVERAVAGLGWGHTKCWSTGLGEIKLAMNFEDKIKKIKGKH